MKDFDDTKEQFLKFIKSVIIICYATWFSVSSLFLLMKKKNVEKKKKLKLRKAKLFKLILHDLCFTVRNPYLCSTLPVSRNYDDVKYELNFPQKTRKHNCKTNYITMLIIKE